MLATLDNSQSEEQSCAYFKVDGGKWSAANCGRKQKTICEYSPGAKVASNPSILPKGYCPQGTYKFGPTCFRK